MSLHGLFNNSDFGRISIMDFFQEIDKTLGKAFDSGDPEIRTWFLVRQNSLPFILCTLYVLFCTLIGPAIMKNKKPMALRMPMIIFNAFLVASYSILLFLIFTNLPKLSFEKFCKGGTVKKGDLTYMLTRCCWLLYLLKYVEFLDTVFFVLRKKTNSISLLHVVHHTSVPILGWIILRTETSGFQSIPVLVNGFIHIIMYSYYGLAAIGPQMKPYLWWKKYLTIMQMAQFIFIFLFVLVIAPISGCRIMKQSIVIDYTGAILFFMLFYNFYTQNFGNKAKTT